MKKLLCLALVVLFALTFAVNAFAVDASTAVNAADLKAYLESKLASVSAVKPEDIAAAKNYIDSYIATNDITVADVTAIKEDVDDAVALFDANATKDGDIYDLPGTVKTQIVNLANEAGAILETKVAIEKDTATGKADVTFVKEDAPATVIYSTVSPVKSTGFGTDAMPIILVASASLIVLAGAYVFCRKLGANA